MRKIYVEAGNGWCLRKQGKLNYLLEEEKTVKVSFQSILSKRKRKEKCICFQKHHYILEMLCKMEIKNFYRFIFREKIISFYHTFTL
jgi:hypothetical protein